MVRDSHSEDNSTETVLTSVEDFPQQQQPSAPDSSLTPSEDSDSTRVYDLNNRQTRILRNDIIRTSRLPAKEPTRSLSPTNSYRRPQSPAEVKFEQLDQFKRAIEPSLSPTSRTTIGLGCNTSPMIGLSHSVQTRPSSNLQQFAVAPKAKRIAAFPFAKMEVDPPQQQQHQSLDESLPNGQQPTSVEEYPIPTEEAPKTPFVATNNNNNVDPADVSYTTPMESDYLVSIRITSVGTRYV